MGNEGQGIRDEIQRISDQMIRIPSYGNSAAESLNVAMATGIILSELKRRGG
jgi:TrmH family RNA methyltransferase